MKIEPPLLPSLPAEQDREQAKVEMKRFGGGGVSGVDERWLEA